MCPLHRDLALLPVFCIISPSAAHLWQGRGRSDTSSNITLGLPRNSVHNQYQPHKSYTLGLRDFYSLQKGRSKVLSCGCLRVAPVTRAENCGGVFLNMPFPSHLHVSLLLEKLKPFAVFLALPQPLCRIQIKMGGCPVCLFISLWTAAPPRSQEGRKRQSDTAIIISPRP